MNKQDLIEIGFKEIPHYTVTDSVIYDLGRHRQLSVGCVGTPNEMVFISETSDKNDKLITDLICLHNYDYDGYLTDKKIKSLVNIIMGVDVF